MKKRIVLFSLLGLLLISCQETQIASVESSSQSVQGELIDSKNSLEFNPFDSSSVSETPTSSEKTEDEIKGDAKWQSILGTYNGYDIASSDFTLAIADDAIVLTNVYEDDNVSLSLIRKASANPAINYNHTESNGYFTFVATSDEECIIEFWDNYGNYSLEVLDDPNATIINETYLYLEGTPIELEKAA